MLKNSRNARPHRRTSRHPDLQLLEPRQLLSGAPPVITSVSRVTWENTVLDFGTPASIDLTNHIKPFATDFFSAYSDPEGDPLQAIRFEFLPSPATLFLTINGVTKPIRAGQVIPADEISGITCLFPQGFANATWCQWSASDGTSFSAPSALTIGTYFPDHFWATFPDSAEDQIGSPAPSYDLWDCHSIPGINLGTTLQYTFSPPDFASMSSTSVPLTSIIITALPEHGSLALKTDSSLVSVTPGQTIPIDQVSSLIYTPVPDFAGTDSFSWNPTNAYADPESPLTFNLIVPSEVSDFSRSLVEDQPLPFNPSDFTSHFTGTLQSIQFTSLPSHGTLSLNTSEGPTPVSLNQIIPADQISNLTYTPDPGYTGQDSLQWTTADARSPRIAISTVSLTVSPFTLSPFSLSIPENVTFSAPDTPFPIPTARFQDASTSLPALRAIQILTLPSIGTLTLSSPSGDQPVTSGQIIPADQLVNLQYTPPFFTFGTTSFSWTASDGQAFASTPGKITINIDQDPGPIWVWFPPTPTTPPSDAPSPVTTPPVTPPPVEPVADDPTSTPTSPGNPPINPPSPSDPVAVTYPIFVNNPTQFPPLSPLTGGFLTRPIYILITDSSTTGLSTTSQEPFDSAAGQGRAGAAPVMPSAAAPITYLSTASLLPRAHASSRPHPSALAAIQSFGIHSRSHTSLPASVIPPPVTIPVLSSETSPYLPLAPTTPAPSNPLPSLLSAVSSPASPGLNPLANLFQLLSGLSTP